MKQIKHECEDCGSTSICTYDGIYECLSCRKIEYADNWPQSEMEHLDYCSKTSPAAIRAVIAYREANDLEAN